MRWGGVAPQAKYFQAGLEGWARLDFSLPQQGAHSELGLQN